MRDEGGSGRGVEGGIGLRWELVRCPGSGSLVATHGHPGAAGLFSVAIDHIDHFFIAFDLRIASKRAICF